MATNGEDKISALRHCCLLINSRFSNLKSNLNSNLKSNLKSCCSGLIRALSCRFSWKAGAAPSGLWGVRHQVWERGGLQGLPAGYKDRWKNARLVWGTVVIFTEYPSEYFLIPDVWVFYPRMCRWAATALHAHKHSDLPLWWVPKLLRTRAKLGCQEAATVLESHPLGFRAPSLLCHTCFSPFSHSAEWFLEWKEMKLTIEKVFFPKKKFFQFTDKVLVYNLWEDIPPLIICCSSNPERGWTARFLTGACEQRMLDMCQRVLKKICGQND